MRAPSRLLDLSWPVLPGLPLFPGDPPLEFRRMGSLETHGYLSHQLRLPAHSGTHVDAPGHVLAGGAMLADLPLERFRGAGALLDLRTRADRAVRTADLLPHMERLRALAPAFVLLATGDETRWGRPEYFTQGAYLEPEAAQLLAGLPGLSGLGLDAGSADPVDSRELPAHKALLGAGVLIVENLRGLDALPASGFEFWCLPAFGLDGSPVRAAALLPQPEGA